MLMRFFFEDSGCHLLGFLFLSVAEHKGTFTQELYSNLETVVIVLNLLLYIIPYHLHWRQTDAHIAFLTQIHVITLVM